MENVTYKQGQLEGFTVKELKTLDLYTRMGENIPKGLNKADLVDLMMRAQAKEVADAKSDETPVKEETTDVVADETEATPDTPAEETEKDSDVPMEESPEDDSKDDSEEEAKDEKPIVFHRSKNHNNSHRKAMGFK